MTELTASCSQKPTQGDAARSLLKGYGCPGITNTIATLNVLCRNLSHMNFYRHIVLDWCISTSAIQEQDTGFPAPSALPGDSESSILQNGAAGDVAPQAFVLSQHQESHCHTVCLSSSTAWGWSAAWLHHQPGVTQCSSQSCGPWWAALAARVHKVTPLNHLPTPLWQTNAEKASARLHRHLGPCVSYQWRQICVSTNNRGTGEWQQVASHCPGSRTVMRGERNAVSTADALKHMGQSPNSSHTLCSARALERAALWLQVITRWCLQRHCR